MPRYDFECKKCGVKEEKTLKIDERNKKQKCKCGQKMTRVPSATSPPQFRGDGFTPKFYK